LPSDLNRLRRIREKLIEPLIILGLSDLIVLTNRGHRLAFKALKHDDGFDLGVPLPSLHG
jgi:hypothetical protein